MRGNPVDIFNIHIALKNIKKLYKNGDLVLNQKALEKLLKYLEPSKILEVAGQQKNKDSKE